MADEVPKKSKANLVKVAIGVVLAALGYGGADMAGLELDPAALKFGLGGSILLIAYVELRFMPLVPEFRELLKRIAARDKREAVEEEPIPIESTTAVTGRARIAVVRPTSVDET